MIFESKPLILVFPVTYKCNCKCVMCSIWKKQEKVKDIPYETIENIFKSPVFSSLENIQITGGEPGLRTNLLKIISLLISSTKRLKHLSIASNGILTDLVVQNVGAVMDLISPGVSFYASFSLDGIGDMHDYIRGTKGAFDKVMLTARLLREKFSKRPNFKMGFNCVLSSFNYGQAEEILGFCRREGFDIGFTLANRVSAYIESASCDADFSLTREQKKYVKNFFEKLNREQPCDYFKMVIGILSGAKRKMPCYAKEKGLLIDADGYVYPCGQSSDLKYGDIYKNEISEIWRKRMNKKIKDAFRLECGRCVTNCYPPKRCFK